jgi:hypothetical protein
MAQVLDFESDQFLQLLTDALRAGPGSPAWHQAVQKLESSPNGADEYRLLVTAREHLESGKSYRSIRPGPAFTRKVLDAVEAEARGDSAPGRSRFSMATWIALISGAIGVAAVCVIVYLLSTGAERQENADLNALSLQSFTHPMTRVISFEKNIPEGWKTIGSIPIRADKGLKVDLSSTSADQGAGGLFRSGKIPPDVPCQIDLDVRYTAGAGVVPEIFITDEPPSTFNEFGATPHELVWTLLNNQPQVELPDQSFIPVGAVVSKSVKLPVRIKLDAQFAIIETTGPDGGRWMGAHQLATDQPRYIGIRFLVRNANSDHGASVESFRLSQP